MARNRKQTSRLIHSIKYNSTTQVAIAAIACFVIAVACASAFGVSERGFSFFSVLFLLFLMLSASFAGIYTALKSERHYYMDGYGHSRIFMAFHVNFSKFPDFWEGGQSKASYRAYKKFLDSFGHACIDDKERELVLKIILRTASSNSYYFTLDEDNRDEVAEKLREFGIEGNVAAAMSGVPLDDVFA